MKKQVIHQNKTKAELITDLQKNAKWVAKMKFAREEFYPALVDLDESIDETKMFIGSINNIMMEKFLGFMKEKKFSELKLIEVLDKKDEKYEKYVDILNLFNEHSIFDAKDCIEGMKSELDLFVSDELKTRKFSTLKVRWLDEI